jgi:hypothetical protein
MLYSYTLGSLLRPLLRRAGAEADIRKAVKTRMKEKESKDRMELDEKTYLQVLNQCSKAVEQIRANFSNALEWYHYLGRVLIQHNLHGEGIKGLSRDLGSGFSQTTLYRCIEFARTYPDPKAFFRDYGVQSWRNVTRILVKRSRNLHACKTIAGASEPSLPGWIVQLVNTCPYCAKPVSLSIEYGNGKVTVRANRTEQPPEVKSLDALAAQMKVADAEIDAWGQANYPQFMANKSLIKRLHLISKGVRFMLPSNYYTH